jgi:hypothetical protein
MSKLFAIGGPYSFQWVEDYGPVLKVAIPRRIEAVSFKEISELESLAINPYNAYLYHKQYLGDVDTRKSKVIYIGEDLSTDEGIHLLKEYLLKQFILMEVD